MFTRVEVYRNLSCFQGIKDLSDFVEFKMFPRIPFHEIFSAAGDDLLDLLERLFYYGPTIRISATDVRMVTLFSYVRIKLNFMCCVSWLWVRYLIIVVEEGDPSSRNNFPSSVSQVFFKLTKHFSKTWLYY